MQSLLPVPYHLTSGDVVAFNPFKLSFFLADNITEFYGQADGKIEMCPVLNMKMEMRFCGVSGIPAPSDDLAAPDGLPLFYGYAPHLQMGEMAVFSLGMLNDHQVSLKDSRADINRSQFAVIAMAVSRLLGIAGFVVMFIVMAAYFFACQFRLSHGNTDALRKDWPIMLALNAVPLMLAILQVQDEKWPESLFGGLSILMAGLGGALAGAVVASRAARKREGAQ